MSNNMIKLAMRFIPLLDEVYKNASLTSVLDGNPDLAKQGANVNELIIPMLKMDGLGDYSRNDGYVDGDVELTHETKKCNYDRGRIFTVDTMDNQETANIAFGRLASEFIRTKVVPEVDAFRFAQYAKTKDITTKEQIIATGKEVLAALRECVTKMDEDEVPNTDRHLFITPTLIGMVQDLDKLQSKEVLSRFASITSVPQTRFYTSIILLDGKTAGRKKGGYKKADDGLDINFMVLHRPALIQYPKHIAPKVISPEVNQNADAYKYGYRHVGIAEVYENKKAGVYVNHKKKQ